MSVYRNLPIARKFTLAFGLVCLLCVVLGAEFFQNLLRAILGRRPLAFLSEG